MLVASLCCLHTAAQTGKQAIGIVPFSFTPRVATPMAATYMHSSVEELFISKKRFKVVDRSALDKLTQERALQLSGEFPAETAAELGKSLGANFLLTGHLLQSAASEVKGKDRTGRIVTRGYEGVIILSLKIVDVETGEIITTRTFEPPARTTGSILLGSYPQSTDAAIKDAVELLAKQIDKFIEENFPAQLSIVEIEDAKADEATQILVSGGMDKGLTKGDKLVVMEVTFIEVEGKKRKRTKEIGTIQVTKVESEFASCKVKSGGSAIHSRFKNGEPLIILSSTK
jgi:hypothetical protein